MKHLPDWKDATAYPNEQSFQEENQIIDDPLYTSKAWAWQFLRRNKTFIKESDEAFLESSHLAKSSVATRYGLSFLLHYKFGTSDIIPFINTFSLRSIQRELQREEVPSFEPYERCVVFDLRLPIAAQLELARVHYEEEKRKLSQSQFESRRKRPMVFHRYLRVLDARINGVTYLEIAHHFALEGIYTICSEDGDTGEEKARQDHKRAMDIVTNGYREVAYS